MEETDYKKAIVEIINGTNNERLLRKIYNFVRSITNN